MIVNFEPDQTIGKQDYEFGQTFRCSLEDLSSQYLVQVTHQSVPKSTQVHTQPQLYKDNTLYCIKLHYIVLVLLFKCPPQPCISIQNEYKRHVNLN